MMGFAVVSYRLSPAELAFLREYCTTMKPLVKASNILQSECTSFMGWLLPVIQQLLSKLSRLETTSKTCKPLIRALQNGLQKRFGPMMEDPELAAAAVLLPKFKTTWTDRAYLIEAGKARFFQRLIRSNFCVLCLNTYKCVYLITSQSSTKKVVSYWWSVLNTK